MLANTKTTEAPVLPDDLDALVHQARLLIQTQRDALRQADLAGILGTAEALHRLADRMNSLPPSAVSGNCQTVLIDLRHLVLHQSDLVRRISAATPGSRTVYPRGFSGEAARSVLLDQRS